MALVTIETRGDEMCQHIAIYSLSNLCVSVSVCVCVCVCACACVCACVCVWVELIVLPKMHCTCGWSGSIAEQLDDQCVRAYSYPVCKRILCNTKWNANLTNFFTEQVKKRRMSLHKAQMHKNLQTHIHFYLIF